MTSVWRVRMRAGAFGDYSKKAWQRGEVGVWYGGWSAEDFLLSRNSPKCRELLSESVGHQPVRVHWGKDPAVTESYIHTTRRFADIPENDWVLLAFKSGTDTSPAYHLGVGRLASELRSQEDHPFNLRYDDVARELFKFRQLHSQKQFRLSELPEVYRLIPQTGQGNVFRFGALEAIVNQLILAQNEDEIWRYFGSRSITELIHILGPKGWESLAEAYLISEEQYLPVGLVVGKTLKTFDLLGRSRQDGAQIAASCKNDRGAIPLPGDFRDAVLDMPAPARAYFFAYGGCSDVSLPQNVVVMDGPKIVNWLQNSQLGRDCLRLLGRA